MKRNFFPVRENLSVFCNILSIIVVPGLIFTFSGCATEATRDQYSRAYEAKAIREVFNEKVILADSATAFAFLDSAIRQSYVQDKPSAKAMALGCLGVAYSNRLPGEYQKAAMLFNKAIEMADRNDHAFIAALFKHHLGYNQFKRGEKQSALQKMLEANYEVQSLGYENLEGYSSCLYQLARVYFSFGNMDRAAHFLEHTFRHGGDKNSLKLPAYNMQGLIFLEKKDFAGAKRSFDAALDIALQSGDSALIGAISANQGRYYLEMEEYPSAYRLLSKGYSLLERHSDNWMNQLAVLLKLLKVDIVQKEVQRAEQREKKIKELMKKKGINHPKARSELYRRLTELYTLKRKPRLTIAYYDSLQQADAEIKDIRNSNMLANIEAQVAAEKHMGTLKLLREEEKIKLIKRNAMAGLSLVFTFFVLYVLYRSRQNQKRERRQFMLEKNKAEQALYKFKKEVKDKEERIDNFRSRLQEYSRNQEKLGSERAEEKMLEQLYGSSILTEEDWFEFKKVFQKVYPDFFSVIQARYEKLTESEIRLLALIKLGLSVREIAGILGILPQSVRKTRQRLMKKLELSHHRELPALVAGL